MLTPPNTRELLHNLTHVTDAEVHRLALSAPCKSSDLHPLPTSLVEDCLDILVTPIVSIVNLSLSEGCFPSHFNICLLIYRALHEEQPVYLRFLIATSLPSRSPRSNRGITLSVPRIKNNSGAMAFTSCGPSFWNNLPLFVHSATSAATFRRLFETDLFDLAFPP